MSEAMKRTYVFENTEVRLTGRIAQRPITPGKAPLSLIEVMPVNEWDGTWKKWAPRASLFDIHEGAIPDES